MNYNFEINSNGEISQLFLKNNCFDFHSASEFIRNLPYRRNLNKDNLATVFIDEYGTCSTKHAYLKRISEEFSIENVQLMICIFMMNENNSPKIKSVLEKYNLLEMPEAHNYLRIDGRIIDCTKKGFSEENFIDTLAEEIEINPNQVTDFKVQYHQDFLKKYLLQHSEIQYSLEEFWKIREECILALQSL